MDNSTIITLVTIIVAISIIGVLWKVAKNIVSYIIGGILLFIIITGGYAAYKNDATNLSEVADSIRTETITVIEKITGTVNEEIEKQRDKPQSESTSDGVDKIIDNGKNVLDDLLKYTNESSAGPTLNYYVEMGPAQLVDSSDISIGELKFTSDEQGRSSLAKGKLTYQMWEDSRGSRQGDPLSPAGWPGKNPQVKIPYQLTNKSYSGWFYNRSHSIGDSLGGKATYTSKNNFTTGTRPQNVGADWHGGMRKPEETVENYWKQNKNSKTIIEYQTLPIYHQQEVIPRGSLVNIKSDDNIINVEYMIINSAEGWNIDYNTGAISAK